MLSELAPVMRQLDTIEALVSDRAFAGAERQLVGLGRELSDLRGQPGGEVLWHLFLNLRAAVETHSASAVGSVACDLRSQLSVRRPQTQAAHP